MRDDELLATMWRAFQAAEHVGHPDGPMAAILAVVRAHDSASPTALANSGPKERQEAFDALKEELDDALAELAALRAERDALKLQAERLIGVAERAMNREVKATDFAQQWKCRAEKAEAEAAGLRADAERWRAVSAMMTHEHRADAVGWTLGALLPGDDPDAAADAVIAARAGGEHAS